MAVDHHKAGLLDIDIEQAYGVLKKGSHLLKYRRRGKPKDESALIWYSAKKEKQIKLSNALRIIPGQRSALFQRHPQPEKVYQSFSLILSDRSLDLICKGKEEADVWFFALKTLLCRNKRCKSEGSELVLPDEGGTQGVQGPLDKTSDNSSEDESVPNYFTSLPVEPTDKSAVQSSNVEATRDGSSSSSSQSSSHDDHSDELGDVFIWGEGVGDGMLGGGLHKVGTLLSSQIDALIPKTLTSAVIPDAHSIACGSRHAVVVTKQGEIFSWGEEAGGQLGHGSLEVSISHPKLIDTLSGLHVESVACGEQHTCAVTLSGDLYSWGDGVYNSGLLGDGGEVGHWLPKRVSHELDGLHVTLVACGPWHTAVVPSTGQLFTFGDGSFGALGHGDHSSTRITREVEALKGLRTTWVSCGVWHTAAAAIEVTDEESTASLHTWGDGDKGQLGHGDKGTRLSPERVSELNDVSISQVACGHSITVALTTSGQVYTMGSAAYGQLGNPTAKGEVPTRVLGSIMDSCVDEISCGSYHVAIRTSKPEVYTWGRGGNGQLGHGDNTDKVTPTLVDFFKDKQIKSVKCGSNFTTAICLNKGLSGCDDSVCSSCHNPFGFRRKRHNCYNCGLVFCKSCSSKKSLGASLAPDMISPYRVCDDCFTKLKNATESSSVQTLDGDRETQGQNSSFIPSTQPKRRNFILDMSLVPTTTASIFSVLALKKAPPNSVPSSKTSSKEPSPISRSVILTSHPSSDMPPLINCSKNKELIYLRAQVEDLTSKSRQLEAELEKTSNQLKEATTVAADEAEKCKSANEVMRLLTAQLKEATGRVPQEYTDYIGEDTNRLSSESEINCDSENDNVANGTKREGEEAESKDSGFRPHFFGWWW